MTIHEKLALRRLAEKQNPPPHREELHLRPGWRWSDIRTGLLLLVPIFLFLVLLDVTLGDLPRSDLYPALGLFVVSVAALLAVDWRHRRARRK